MDSSRLTPQPPNGEKRQKALQDAKDMSQRVRRICERNNRETPPYEFLELIGKGQFGRVYKSRDLRTGQLVAVKIILTDDLDYQGHALDRDDTIRDFRKEIAVLQQLKDARSKNINMIQEAFDFGEQLWIVSEYCTGGSIKTLMRASPPSQPGLEEQFIVPIARELAVAIKCVHDIGVIHRDIKATNVFINEEGDIQLGDFGIVGVTNDEDNKRRTVIGTPHYMTKEMLAIGESNQVKEGYGKEIDVWAYGCTVYEMATGLPPNANVAQHSLSKALMTAPRLEGGNHSQELRDFIAFCLNSDPQQRPTIDAVLKHPYISNTTKRYPSKGLVNLIHRYKVWEYGGGYRASLFMAGGAPPAAEEDQEGEDDGDFDDWNFSTSDTFNADFDKRYSQMVAGDDSHGLRIDTSNGNLHPLQTNGLTPLERAYQEMSASRGEMSLGRLWNPNAAPYELHTPVENPRPVSDLPFRNLPAGPPRESIIDLDSAGNMDDDVPAFNFDFGEPTVKAGRMSKANAYEEEEEEEYEYGTAEDFKDRPATMEWKFPTARPATMDWKFPAFQPTEPEDPDMKMNLPPAADGGDAPPGFRPKLIHTSTEPLGQFRDYMHTQRPVAPMTDSPVRKSMASMIDLDIGVVDDEPTDHIELRRPSTASSNAESIMTDMTSGNPFFLEDDPAQKEIDRNRYSSHKHYQSEGGQFKRSSRRSVPMHTRGSSLSSTGSDMERQLPDDGMGYGYNAFIGEDPNQQLSRNHSFSSDLSAWPAFDRDSRVEDMPPYNDDMDTVSRVIAPNGKPYTNGDSYPRSRQLSTVSSMSTVSIVEPNEVEFPHIMAPRPEALREHAPERLVISEFSRLCAEFEESLKATSHAIQQRAEVWIEEDYDTEGVSETESSSGLTGDDDDDAPV